MDTKISNEILQRLPKSFQLLTEFVMKQKVKAKASNEVDMPIATHNKQKPIGP